MPRTRISRALRGESLSPPVAGLTFVAAAALASVAPGCGDEVACMLAACDALKLDFVFAPAGTGWAEVLAERSCRCGVLWVVDGPLWPALLANGVGEGLRATVRAPASLRPVLERETARAAAQVRDGIALGVDGIVIADDLAGEGGPIVPTAFIEAEVMPRLASLAGLACAAGLPAVFHSDGDIRALLPDVLVAGFRAVHGGATLDREGFERMYWAAHREGLTVVGGIRTSALERGVYAAVRAGTRVALLAQAGGLVVADDGGITTPGQMAAFGSALAAARGAAPAG